MSFIGVAELFSKAQRMGQRDFRVLQMLLLAGAIWSHRCSQLAAGNVMDGLIA